MAELTKIFTGMEQGPEKIDANFSALNTENKNREVFSKQSNWREISVTGEGFASDVETSPLAIYRYGKTVYLKGSLKHSGKTGEAFKIPVGFKPIHDIHLDLPEMSGSTTYQARIYIIKDAFSVVALNGNAPIWVDGISYITEDDFPS